MPVVRFAGGASANAAAGLFRAVPASAGGGGGGGRIQAVDATEQASACGFAGLRIQGMLDAREQASVGGFTGLRIHELLEVALRVERAPPLPCQVSSLGTAAHILRGSVPPIVVK